MLKLTDRAAVKAALTDPELRALLGFRAWHMCVEHEGVIGTDVQMFVIQPGDTPEVINAALGFPMTGDQAEEPSFLSIEDHGHHFELSYARDHDSHTRVFVTNDAAVELGVHLMCLSQFWPDHEQDA